MKKNFLVGLFIMIFSLVGISSGFSDLYKPHRIFEVGFDSSLYFANNYLGLKDVLKKDIEIDLEKIAREMPSNGFSFSAQMNELFFVNLNVSSRFRFSLFSGVETSSKFDISKDLFDLLASGIGVDDSVTVDVSGYADVFGYTGLSYQTIICGYGVKIAPTYFVPIVYVPKTTATATIKTESSGKIHAHAESNLEVYTAVDMHDFLENDKKFENLDLSAGNLMPNGGLDLGLEVERNWIHGLNAGIYSRIPVVPGKMKHKMSTRVFVDFYEENLLGYIDGSENHENDSGHDDFVYSDADYKVNRPLRFGLNASYTPFGLWFKIQPQLGFAVRNPFSSDAIFYPEYALDLKFSFLWSFLNLDFGTAYQNMVFQHKFGLSVNIRAVEIVTQASFCGTNLSSSFKRTGYGMLVGMRIGF